MHNANTLLQQLKEGKRDFTLKELGSLFKNEHDGKPYTCTLAHVLTTLGYYMPDDSPCMSWEDSEGDTIAHLMVAAGHVFDFNNPCLKWKNKGGVTVAHLMVLAGTKLPEDHDCLGLIANDGKSVRDMEKLVETVN